MAQELLLIQQKAYPRKIRSFHPQSTIWYHKSQNGENITVAKIVNQTTHPLVISDTEVGQLLGLSYFLKPTVQIFIQPRCVTCPIQPANTFRVPLPAVKELKDFSDVFLYHHNPSKVWLKELAKQQNYKFEPLVFALAKSEKDRPVLWRVTRN